MYTIRLLSPGKYIPSGGYDTRQCLSGTGLDEVLNDVEATVLAVPSQYKKSGTNIPFIAKDHVIVNVAKAWKPGQQNVSGYSAGDF